MENRKLFRTTLNDLRIPVEMVLTYIKELAVNKATGLDGIPAHLLKETAEQIAPLHCFVVQQIIVTRRGT